MPVDSDSLGAYLRQERQRRQVSLQEIAAATKIQLKFLEALENDAYDQLPAAPFVVGFLRAYAQYIALDPETVLAAYRALQPPPQAEGEGRRPVQRAGTAAPRLSLIRLVAVLAGLGLVLGLVMYEWRRGQPAQSAVASLPAPRPPSTEGVGRPVPPSLPGVVRLEPPAPAPVTPTMPVTVALPQESSPAVAVTPPAESPAAVVPPVTETVMSSAHPGTPADRTAPLVLQAKVRAATWLRIAIDAHKPLSLLLSAGKSFQWEAQERFRLTIGNARGIRLTLNGQDIPLQVDRSNVVRDFLLTRASLP